MTTPQSIRAQGVWLAGRLNGMHEEGWWPPTISRGAAEFGKTKLLVASGEPVDLAA